MYKLINSLAIIVFFVLGTTHSFAQQGVSNEINNLKASGEHFELNRGVFQIVETPTIDVGSYFNNPNDVVYLQYDQSILKNQNQFVSIEIPYNGTSLTLDLMDVSDQFVDIDIEVRGKDDYVASTDYKHYRGMVRGDNRSLASLSFFDGNVMGVVSFYDGNLNIVKMNNSNDIIFYKEGDLNDKSEFLCSTENGDFKGYDPKMLMAQNSSTSALSTSGHCVGLYFETEFDMFQSLGTLGNVANYVTALYNEVATIYQNENITTRISQLVMWAIADPYTATNTGGLLSQFQAQISTLNGDLGQLLTFRSVGGGRAAGFNGLCNANVDQSLSVSGNLSNTVTPFPTYSWNVMVVTHEFGHLFGSRHTHACVWNGNNTAIDGCSGFTEGSCPVPTPLPPANGGTIMSYCHGSVGVGFNLGFGPQPGNVIRNSVDNAACLLDCCPEHVVIAPDVPAFGVDHQEAEFTITAFNTVNASAEAVYHAGDEVLLLDDFDALNGSEFRAYIEGCSGIFVKSALTDASSDSETLDQSLLDRLKLSPNPTRDEFTIDLTASEFTWNISEIELYDLKGQRISLNNFIEIGRNTFRVNIADLEKGVYVVKLLNLESNESYVKRVVKL